MSRLAAAHRTGLRRRPVNSITKAGIAHWLGGLVSSGASASSVNRHLATLRPLLGYAVADGRVRSNPAMGIKPQRSAHSERGSAAENPETLFRSAASFEPVTGVEPATSSLQVRRSTN